MAGGNYTISVGTVGGGLSVSPDGGDRWDKLPKEFGEIRSLALTPND